MDGTEIIIGYAVGYVANGIPVKMTVMLHKASLDSDARHLTDNPSPNGTASVQCEVTLRPCEADGQQ